MSYKIFYDFDLDKIMRKIPLADAKYIKKKISEVAENPRLEGYIKLSGLNGYRVRVGNYRIIYDIFDDKLFVLILEIGDRSSIYKKK